MAEKRTGAGTEKTAEKTVPESVAEIKYTLLKLRKCCVKVLGVTTSTFDGAFYGRGKDEKYTIREAKEIISKWLKRG